MRPTLKPAQVAALLAAAGEDTRAAALAAEGFMLKPARAPRRLVNGDTVLRFTWEKRVGSTKITNRMVITMLAQVR